MSFYLHDIPLPQALECLETALLDAGRWGVLGSESIPLDQNALGRTLAEPVWARLSSPHYHASAMDGFAVRSLDTVGASPNNPLTLLCRCDSQMCAEYVDTGDPLPEWADAVVQIENTEPMDLQPDPLPAENPRRPDAIRIRTAVTPWHHVRPMGEDMVATQLVLPAGHILRPVDLGAIAGCGHNQILAALKPRVAIIPTGTELVPAGQAVRPGEIIEYNSIVLAAQVEMWGGQARRYAITPDDFEKICVQVATAAQEADLILLNAGSSAGSEDFSAQVVDKLGDLLVHGIAIRPGHPVILGMIERDPAASESAKVPIIGVPGYPVSAALTGEIFVEPLLSRWLGHQPAEPPQILARLTRKVTSRAGDDDYMRVVVGRVDENLLAAPLARGSGVITSLVRADGIVIMPRGSQGLPAGANVHVRLYRPLSEIERTIFAIGSHDMTLDLVAQYLADKSRRLTSANVGSLAGLVALRRGEAHLAGTHLLDPETGVYNLAYIRQYLPGIAVKVVAFVGRQQGLLCQKGNPKSIDSLTDLIQPDIRFVNRQRGAGTRVLLDYHLEQLGIDRQAITGYTQEEYTHLAVAAAVASGRADCGLGIAAAAQALDLDFVPLYEERYELVVPERFFGTPLLEPFFDLLNDPGFRHKVAELPGYDIERMGDLVAEVN